MNIRRFPLAVAFVAALALAGWTLSVACGGGSAASESDPNGGGNLKPAQIARTQTAFAQTNPSPTPTDAKQTADAGPYPGPAPKLGPNVTLITPTNGQSITQLDSQSPNPQRPRGVCFVADFKGLPETGLWFRMALDGVEVTTKLTWILASRDNPEGGRACYAPAEGIKAGRHSAAVSVQNPNNPNEPVRELVAWKFEVTP